MSQKYVALSVGVSAPMVSQWESGKKKPSYEKIIKLAELFNVTIDYLLDHEVDESPQTLTIEERQLLEIFNQLNRTGKNSLLKVAESLLQDPGLREKESIKLGK